MMMMVMVMKWWKWWTWYGYLFHGSGRALRKPALQYGKLFFWGEIFYTILYLMNTLIEYANIFHGRGRFYMLYYISSVNLTKKPNVAVWLAVPWAEGGVVSYVSLKDNLQFPCKAAMQCSIRQHNVIYFVSGCKASLVFACFYASLFWGKPQGLRATLVLQ